MSSFGSRESVSKLPHQHPQVWHVIRRFVSPGVQDQLAVGDHQAELRGQKLQQPVLLARQRDVPAPPLPRAQ
jgi:hypothetical protein